MSSGPRPILNQGKKLFCLILLSLAFFSSYDLQNILKNLKEFQTLNNGVQTCFSRVNQSFTSKVIGKALGSAYLNPSFFNLTEECFGDVISRMEENFGAQIERVEGKLNTLTSEVFWFHGDLKGIQTEVESIGLSPKGKIGIKDRFSKMEELTGKIFSEMESADSELMGTLEYKRIAFYISFFGIFALILFDLLLGKRAQGQKNKIEKNAEVIKKKVSHNRDTKVETIIADALSTSNMPKVSQLFASYSQRNFATNMKHSNWRPIKPNTSPPRRNVESNLKTIPLSEIFSKTLEIHSPSLFTQGIYLDLNLNEDIHPLVPVETLEQLFFSVFSFAIKNIPQETQGKRISIKSKQLGDTAIIEMSNNGPEFKHAFLKGQKGLEKNGEVPEIDLKYIDLKVGIELVKDCKGQIFFENIDGIPTIKIKIKSILKKASKSKLVSLKQGRPQDLRAGFGA